MNNDYDFLYDRAVRCWQADPTENPWGQIPTFINLDHYHVPTAGGSTPRPDPFDVVDELNRLWPNAP